MVFKSVMVLTSRFIHNNFLDLVVNDGSKPSRSFISSSWACSRISMSIIARWSCSLREMAGLLLRTLYMRAFSACLHQWYASRFCTQAPKMFFELTQPLKSFILVEVGQRQNSTLSFSSKHYIRCHDEFYQTWTRLHDSYSAAWAFQATTNHWKWMVSQSRWGYPIVAIHHWTRHDLSFGYVKHGCLSGTDGKFLQLWLLCLLSFPKNINPLVHSRGVLVPSSSLRNFMLFSSINYDLYFLPCRVLTKGP